MIINETDKIRKAIKIINANARFTISGADIDTIEWIEETTPIAKADIEAKLSEAETMLETEAQAKIDLKASAKAKLISGEALTEEEANTIVL